ncbi:DUF2829 domain-containing protein [Xenorhabdus doucetiae]|uniref:Uncharacterized protein DUF2829 n=1 Tax=Xenorhabdus doucetiae TaxID=351671 RepID=A0A068QNH4_9GAMM|nr:DUF2829 domain-containing protein [Xenorhabdus doucetiae]TYO93321.1 uncharacterized protein DUF2829 [Xenorhabdus doucetiae]CDG16254.1 protein of unknown function [Xenorhabdus doucetiae]
MSEINKPENNDASLNCPFNPDIYNLDYLTGNITVPVGTFAWALSQVCLGQHVYRSGWNSPEKYVRLAYGQVSIDKRGEAPYIEKSDKDGYWVSWKPTQEDLMACDWKFFNDANLHCPFNPTIYYNLKDWAGNITAPVGTFAWALSRVYLGQHVYRSGWNAPKEYVRLAYEQVSSNKKGEAPYIEKSDKDGYWVSWQPTQEDLMACDWKLLQQDIWMSFDINLGYTTVPYWSKAMGYLSNDMIPIIKEKHLFEVDPEGSIIQNSFGTLSNVQNQATSAIRAVEGFMYIPIAIEDA